MGGLNSKGNSERQVSNGDMVTFFFFLLGAVSGEERLLSDRHLYSSAVFSFLGF